MNYVTRKVMMPATMARKVVMDVSLVVLKGTGKKPPRGGAGSTNGTG
jgi:hypothetical protein